MTAVVLILLGAVVTTIASAVPLEPTREELLGSRALTFVGVILTAVAAAVAVGS